MTLRGPDPDAPYRAMVTAFRWLQVALLAAVAVVLLAPRYYMGSSFVFDSYRYDSVNDAITTAASVWFLAALPVAAVALVVTWGLLKPLARIHPEAPAVAMLIGGGTGIFTVAFSLAYPDDPGRGPGAAFFLIASVLPFLLIAIISMRNEAQTEERLRGPSQRPV